jgi:glycosyltransferase involved in cell wall biosynthesis
VELSVVVCVFNPANEVLRRVLTAIKLCMRGHGGRAECVVVDNNSSPPVSARHGISQLLRDMPNTRLVRESRQGLSFARARGVSETNGDIIIFFDDDNEPEPTYLTAVSQVFRAYPQVGVFGPGNVEVEFLGGVPEWVDASCRHFFQERHSTFIEFACIRQPWNHIYPPGTGQSVRREVVQRYVTRVAEGSCTASDRSGNALSSGGDGQIVHTAVLMGYAAGVHPGMRLRHLIPASRCTVEYLSRLGFGVCAVLLPATMESFPELRDRGEYAPPSWARYQRQKWLAALREPLMEPAPLRCIHAAARVGDAVGRYIAAGRPVPSWLEREKQRLGLT